jgi:CRP/FNR family cyclic AMP-dependent transcriptional regulator
MAVAIDELRRVHFLAPLKDRELRRLAGSMSERRASAGEDLVTQGSGAIAFFVLLEGQASVIVDGEERRTLGPGDHFGEIALVLPDTRRTATVRAIDDVRLGALATWNFKGFVADHPEVTWPLLVGLARQIATRGH